MIHVPDPSRKPIPRPVAVRGPASPPLPFEPARAFPLRPVGTGRTRR